MGYLLGGKESGMRSEINTSGREDKYQGKI